MTALTDEFSDNAFEAELQRAQVPVLGFLLRLSANLADARDLLQATNVTAWQKRTEFELGTNLVAWMCSIGRNHYRNESRKRGARPTVPLFDEDLEQMIETRHGEREQEESRKRRLLQVCLGRLPDRQRQVVERYYLQGLTLEKLGEEENRKPNAIAQLLHRARQSLIDCVKLESHQDLDGEALH